MCLGSYQFGSRVEWPLAAIRIDLGVSKMYRTCRAIGECGLVLVMISRRVPKRPKQTSLGKRRSNDLLVPHGLSSHQHHNPHSSSSLLQACRKYCLFSLPALQSLSQPSPYSFTMATRNVNSTKDKQRPALELQHDDEQRIAANEFDFGFFLRKYVLSRKAWQQRMIRQRISSRIATAI